MTPLSKDVGDNRNNRDVLEDRDNTDQNDNNNDQNDNNNENDQNDNNNDQNDQNDNNNENDQNDNNDENDKRSREGEGEEKEEEEVGTVKKRARGRPPGSKNKPKTSVGACGEQQNVFLEIDSGSDIVSSLSAYARTCGRAVSILHATGLVYGCLIVRHPHSHPNSGLWELITLSGTVLPPDNNTFTRPMGLTTTVANPNGQVFGGRIEGRLIAEGPVSILVTTFRPFAYQKLTSTPPPQQQQNGNQVWNSRMMSMGMANPVITGSSRGVRQQTTSGCPAQPQNNCAPPN